MDRHDGPDYQTTVGGTTVYDTRSVIRWMKEHTDSHTEVLP